MNSPNTLRIASAISPTVARASTAATIGGTRLLPSAAARETAPTPSRHASGSRRRPQGLEPRDLSRLDFRIDPEKGSGVFSGRSVGKDSRPLFRKLVDADDDRAAGIDSLLRTKGRFLNFALNEPALNRRERSPVRSMTCQDFPALFVRWYWCDSQRRRSSHRIDGVRDAAFGGDDLLGPERDACGFLRRQRQRLVTRRCNGAIACRRAPPRAPATPPERCCCPAAGP